MAFDDPTSNSGNLPPENFTTAPSATCIGLPEALRLSTRFSVHSNDGEIPTGLEIPIPLSANCAFLVRPWGEVSEAERDAFRRFYIRVGEELEDLAQRARDGRDIDEAIWSEITGQLFGPEATPQGA